MAVFEALKGLIVLAAASGVLTLVHKDVHAAAVQFIEHLHLNPASRYPRIFLDVASRLREVRLIWIAVGAVVYATIRFAEAYGLYREKAWAEVLAAVSGAIYVPFEVAEIVRNPSGHGATLLIVNLLIVGFMVKLLLDRRNHRARNGHA